MDVNTKLKLLSGSSFFVNDIEIKPLTLKQIIDAGYEEYLRLLNIFQLEVDDIIPDIPDEFKEIKIFDLLVYISDSFVDNEISKSIKLFLNKDLIEIDKNKNVIVLNDYMIDRDIWDEIRRIILFQNCIKRSDEPEYNPANKKAQEIIAKIKKLKKEMPKKKEPVDLSSIMSAVAWKSNNINILNIYDLTLYQLYDGLNRLNIIDAYQFNVSALYAGTLSKEDINLKELNWINIINND